VAPLPALSARMRFLEEDVLQEQDRIKLAVRLPELMEKCEKLQAGPVRIWNQSPGKSGTPPQSPTRALRQFLPPAEGGVDTANRLQGFNAQTVPTPAFVQGLEEEGLSAARLESQPAREQLLSMSMQLWQNYAVVPTQQLLRGRLDDCTKRLVRIQSALKDLEGQDPVKMNQDTTAWVQRAKQVYARGDAAKIAELWGEDQALMQMIVAPDEEPRNAKDAPKGILSYIVLRAVAKPMQMECDYLLALRWQEKAERLQVQLQLQQGGGANGLRTATRDAWISAQTFWSNYGHRNSLAVNKFLENVKSVRQQATPAPLLAAMTLDYYAWMLREAAAVKLLQARARERHGQRDGAKEILENVVTELTMLEGDLKQSSELAELRPILVDSAPPAQRETVRKTFDEVSADLGPTGSLFWLRYSALLRLAQLRQKPA